MGTQKEREAFEAWFAKAHYHKHLIENFWDTWQAAKAQAVPDGFVLVDAESLALHTKSIRIFNNSDEEDDHYEIENHVCAIEAMIEAQEKEVV